MLYNLSSENYASLKLILSPTMGQAVFITAIPTLNTTGGISKH